MHADTAPAAGLPTSFDRSLSVLIGSAMLMFAGVKFAYGYRLGLEVGPTTYYTAATFEALAAVLLFHRRSACLGAALTAAFFAVALGFAWVTGVKSCGCLGPIRLASEHYRMIAATLGMLACVLVHRRLTAAPGAR